MRCLKRHAEEVAPVEFRFIQHFVVADKCRHFVGGRRGTARECDESGAKMAQIGAEPLIHTLLDTLGFPADHRLIHTEDLAT